jgi:PTH1 family peptidyl-tRNA hydrolase
LIREWLARLFGRRAAEADSLDTVDPETVRVIVGLGNPGPEYADTRHNVGFRVVEDLARRRGAAWRDGKQSLVARADDLVLVKPLTYMNRSGAAVNELLGRLTVPAQRALVVYDEMDLPFGTLRLRERGSPGTHNGMRDVVRVMQTEDIPRLRIGIGQSQPGSATDHVLGEFTDVEQDEVHELITRAADAALSWAIDGAAVAMNRYNKT